MGYKIITVLVELEAAQSSLERPGDPLEKQQSKWQATYCKVTRRIFIIAFFSLLYFSHHFDQLYIVYNPSFTGPKYHYNVCTVIYVWLLPF